MIPAAPGKKYRYPNDPEILILKRVRGFRYEFRGGHWCTDSVFLDLIDVEAGRPVRALGIQLKINL